jgi:DNA-binding response OmpR family regulator
MKRRRIMVVDESRLLHRMCDLFLRDDFLLHACGDDDARELLARHGDVEVVVIDAAVPHAVGLEVLARVAAHANERRVPIVLVSRTDEPTVHRELHALADAYLRPPLHLHALHEVVARVIRSSPS